ncbi:melanocyte-stimulating hormone receptor-like [Porites lutea]|uniref:melanocyte-stimulating hormone receptor-like n=1 Tax=Porites lutea TaxID=51062 RepID=UPI003CC545B7
MAVPTLEKTIRNLYCSANVADVTARVHDELIVLLVLNTFLSITAFLGNTLILVALHKESSLHPPSKLLLRSLAITDLLVGIIVEPLYVVYLMSVKSKRWDLCYNVNVALFIASHILCSVSLLVLTAISVDRLLALWLGLRYRQVVTLRSVYITVIAMSVLSIVVTTSYIWNELLFSLLLFINLSFCLTIIIFSYMKIFFMLRHYQIQVTVAQEQPRQAIPLNIARYRKAVYSALLVQVTLLICYLPFVIIEALTDLKSVKLSSSVYLTKTFSFSFVFLNSSLNPFLYCWKIKEVRQAVKDTIRQIFCSLT